MLAKVVARKTKVWGHQAWTAVDEQRPWLIVRLRRTTGGTVTLRAGAKGALMKKKMSHPRKLLYADPVTRWKAARIPCHRMRRYFFQSEPEKRKNGLTAKSLRS